MNEHKKVERSGRAEEAQRLGKTAKPSWIFPEICRLNRECLLALPRRSLGWE